MEKAVGKVIAGLVKMLDRVKDEEEKSTLLSAVGLLVGSFVEAPLAEPVPKPVRRVRRTRKASARRQARVKKAAPKPVATETKKAKKPMSAERKAALKIHGSLLGYMRQLPVDQRNKVKALRMEKGPKIALTLAKSLAKKAKG